MYAHHKVVKQLEIIDQQHGASVAMEFSSLKQNMSEAFARIQGKTQSGEFPDLADAELLVRLTRLMEVQAPDEWVDEAADLTHMATQLLQAVKAGQLEESVMIAESIDDAQQYCHRTYQML